jgi:hypothetical protein
MRGWDVNAQGQAILAARFLGATDPADNAAHTVEKTYIEKKSLPFRFREKRFAHIQPLIESVIAKKGSCRIADIGGTAYYWKIAEDFVNRNPVEIHLINLAHVEVSNPKFKSLTGNACALDGIDDNAYDFVHSNSVIEHVGNWDQMTRMAANVRRLAPQYYVQTPNFWFPYEPHFRAPFFHWLPEQVRAELLMRFNLGFGGKRVNLDAAMRGLQSATLISAAQMQYLFPDAKILRERAFGLSKSLMAVRSTD